MKRMAEQQNKIKCLTIFPHQQGKDKPGVNIPLTKKNFEWHFSALKKSVLYGKKSTHEN